MAMNAMGAGFVVTAKDAASAVFRKIGGSMEGLGKRAKTSFERMNMGAGASLGAMGGGMVKFGSAMAGMVSDVADNTAAFDRQMGFIQARGNVTAETMAGMRAQLMGEGFSGKNLDTAAETWARMTEETGNAEDAFRRVKPAMDLARMANIGGAEAATMLADVMDQFQIKGEGAAATADKLAFGMGRFGFLGSEMQTVLSGTSAGAALLNASFDDTLLAVGLIKQRFPNVQKAAMAANMAMNQLADPKVRQELDRVGVSVTDDAGKFRPLTAILGDLSTKTAGWTEEQKASALAGIFNRRAAGGLNVIMDTLTAGVKDASGTMRYGAEAAAVLGAEMQNSAGAAGTMAKAITNDYKGATDRMNNAMDRLRKTIGPAAQGVLRPFKEAAAGAANAAATMLGGMDPASARTIMGVVYALGKLSKAVGLLVVGLGAMKMFGVSFTDLIWTFGKAILIIGPLAVLLGGLAVGMYAVYRSVAKNAAGVGDSWSDMVGKLKLGWQAVVDIISKGELSRATRRELRKTENEGVLRFVQGFERFLERMRAFWDGLKAGFDRGAQALGPGARAVIERFKAIFSIFTGDAANTPEVLAQWGASGAAAGERLAGMGETALLVLGKVADLITILVDKFRGVTSEDITGWIDVAVTSFNGLATSLETIGTVLGGVAKAFETIYDLIRVIGAVIGDVVGGYTTAYQAIGDVIQAPIELVTGGGVSGAKGKLGQAWERVSGLVEHPFEATQREAGVTARDWGITTTAGMTEPEKVTYAREQNRGRAADLRKQQEQVAAYMATTGAEWKAGARPMAGAKVPFGALDPKAQAQWLSTFDQMSRVIRDLGGRPIELYVDREKIATAIGKSGAAQGTRSLDEGDALI